MELFLGCSYGTITKISFSPCTPVNHHWLHTKVGVEILSSIFSSVIILNLWGSQAQHFPTNKELHRMQYCLTITSWQENKLHLSSIRKKVFIQEQRVPEELEWDEFDADSTHILVTDKSKQAIATARMQENGHIGRMAVLKEYRKMNIGRAMLEKLINHARQQKLEKVFLDAQLKAIPFYEKQGFSICSNEFLDANIPHKSMIRALTSDQL